MKIQEQCRCCESKELVKILDLSDQLVSAIYHRGAQVPRWPLKLNFCQNCFHRQLSGVVDPNPLYDRSFFTGCHPAYQNYCENLVNESLKWWKNNREKQKKISVLDIGCGDATLLKMFEAKKCLVQGVEPAQNLREISKEKRIRVKIGYWGNGQTGKNLGRYDLITIIGLLDKIDYLDAFVDDCLAALVDDGCIVMDIPYQEINLGFHNVNHPTLSYFLLSSFKFVIEKKNLFVSKLSKTQYGELRLRFFLTKNDKHCSDFENLLEKERQSGFYDIETYKDLQSISENKSICLKEWAHEIKSNGEILIGCGSCFESNALIAYSDLKLDYMLDNNPMICGYRTPNEILIHPLKYILKEENKCHVLFLSPITRQFDAKEIQDMNLSNCQLIDFYKSF